MKNFNARYWARALSSRYLYAWVPYLRYVGLNGSLVRGIATESSDIDLMVVAEPGHIFTVRFLMVGIIALVGIRRTGRKVAGRLCVNYFLTSDNLDIKPRNRRVAEAYQRQLALIDSRFMIQDLGTSDCHPELVSGSHEIPKQVRNDNVNFQEVIMQQNKWMEKYRVSISEGQKQLNASVKPVGEPWATLRSMLEFLLFPVADALEVLLKKIQIAKIKRHPLTNINPDKIIISDKELRFHPVKHPNHPNRTRITPE